MNKPRNKSTALPVLGSTPEAKPAAEETKAEMIDRAIDRDFGTITSELSDGVSRRRWLQIMGASLALGGTVGCRFEEENIAPFAFRPANRIPGATENYSAMIEFGGVAQPLLATCYDGRPIKLDGNPKHPELLTPAKGEHSNPKGPSSLHTQARVLELYDPDRLRGCVAIENDSQSEMTWKALEEVIGKMTGDMGSVCILAEPSLSPSLGRLRKEFEGKGGRWETFTSVSNDNTLAGAKQAFGKSVAPRYHFNKCKVIVTLDADPMALNGASVVNQKQFAETRDADHGEMSRLYCIESQYSSTGASADHRISVASEYIAGFAAALSAAIAGAHGHVHGQTYREKFVSAVADDLVANKGAGLIIAGENQPKEVHALVHSLNQQLENNGATVEFVEVEDSSESVAKLKTLAADLSGGKINNFIILGGNPVYDGPRDVDLAAAIKGVNSLHLSMFKNETSLCCKYIGNVAHPLETWTDGRSVDGTHCIGQPLIQTLFGGRSEIECLATILGNEAKEGMEIVKETLGGNETDWSRAVHDGFVANSAAPAASVSAGAATPLAPENTWKKGWDGKSLEVVFAPSLGVYDGRFANNAWLQELPDFFTKISWDNVALVSPKTAEALSLVEKQMVVIKVDGLEQKMPVHIQPGQADGSIGLRLGYGRTAAGRVGGDAAKGIDSIGHDANSIRTTTSWNVASEATITSSGSSYRLATVQEPWEIDNTGRDEIQSRMFRNSDGGRSGLIREGSFESYKKFLSHNGHAETKPKSKAPSESALPITNVKFTPKPEVAAAAAKFEEAAGEDDHAAHHWPEAFHLHHENFDITPGAREVYKQEGGYKNSWGMSIDLNKCSGCNACVIACQAENNVPVVGKDDVWRGREMHWIRIDRYFGDNLYNKEAAESDDKQIIHQPVACHHCENAPCETVCPVAATTHSREGLNDMVYNRCIGTRYCGNNCPYKVRRFNFFNYSDAVTFIKYPGADEQGTRKLNEKDRQLQHLVMNPEVTIRSRGVMEKCTYCTQRISAHRIKSKVEKREIGPNEITVACQDACPSQAISFGDINNAESQVHKDHANARSYTMLEELNNIPRTKYMARVRNPHPELMDMDDREAIPKYGHGGASHGPEDAGDGHDGHNDGEEKH